MSAQGSVLFPAFQLFIGCISNGFFLELIIKEQPKSGTLITLAQFICVGLYATYAYCPGLSLPAPSTPMKHHIGMVVIFFIASVCNNLALNYNIPVPLHMIFRSGSLVTNMLLGMLFMGKRYSKRKRVAVVLISVGILIVTYVTSLAKHDQVTDEELFDRIVKSLDFSAYSNIVSNTANFDATHSEPKSTIHHTYLAGFGRAGQYIQSLLDSPSLPMAIGISLLCFALIASSFLGLYQEYVYSAFGKNWKEGMFYSHVLSLPLFLYYSDDLLDHVHLFNQSSPLELRVPALISHFAASISSLLISYDIPIPECGFISYNSDGSGQMFVNTMIPALWVYITLNVLTQLFGITGVFKLTTLISSLSLTLLLTIRKLLSLIISIIYFGNLFTKYHWMGTAMVFSGSYLFLTEAGPLHPSKMEKQADKKKTE